MIGRIPHRKGLGFLLLFAATALPAWAQAVAGPVTPASSSTTQSSYSTNSSLSAPAQTTSPYQGSVPGKLEPGIVPISLQDAINRGLKTNLGLLLSSQDVQAARGERFRQTVRRTA